MTVKRSMSTGGWCRTALAAALAVAVTTLLTAVGTVAGAQVGEYRLKAGFLYTLTKFVEWPAGSFPRPDAPYVICVVGDEAFRLLLQDTIGQRSTGGRSATVTDVQVSEDLHVCHLLFLGESRRWLLDEVRRRTAGGQVLTVGESTDFIEAGGVVALVTEQDRVRLEVNLTAAARSRLKIRSGLLALARVIEERPQVVTR